MIRFEVPTKPLAYVKNPTKYKYEDPKYFRYQEYKSIIRQFGKAATKEKLSGKVSVEFNFYLTGKGRGNLDKFIQGLLDVCSEVCFEKDHEIVEIVARKVPVSKMMEQKAKVIIKPLEV